jgi:DNA-directed RNA polymerase sigma subunit (sigma70/sigma32)
MDDILNWQLDPDRDIVPSKKAVALDLLPWDAKVRGHLTNDASLKAFRKLRLLRSLGRNEEALEVKNLIIIHNLGLIPAAAKKYMHLDNNLLSEILERAYFILDRCVELYDVGSNCKFSTYVFNSLQMFYIRAIQDVYKKNFGPVRNFTDILGEDHMVPGVSNDIDPTETNDKEYVQHILSKLPNQEAELLRDRFLSNPPLGVKEFCRKHRLRESTYRQHVSRLCYKLKRIIDNETHNGVNLGV